MGIEYVEKYSIKTDSKLKNKEQMHNNLFNVKHFNFHLKIMFSKPQKILKKKYKRKGQKQPLIYNVIQKLST